eukprot:Gb_31805 [translate_table: standard]
MLRFGCNFFLTLSVNDFRVVHNVMRMDEHQKRGADGRSEWLELPEHLMERVMECLPLERFFRLRIVCKQWNRLFSDKHFIRIWTEAARRQPWLILCMPKTQMRCLFYSFSTQTWRTVSLSFLPERCTINYKGSAAGLLLVDIPASSSLEDSCVKRYVCNPLNGTWFSLPPMLSITGVMARGIVPGKDTESYKVVVVGKSKKNFVVAEVYNSTAKSWKVAGKLPEGWLIIRNEEMVFCNGFLFCMTVHDGIMAYDVEEERWALVPMPVADSHNIWPRLLACGCSLVMAAAMEEDNVVKDVVIWELPLDQKAIGDSQWREIGKMPRTLCEEFQRSSCSNWFECVGVGDYVCFRAHGSVEVLVCNITQRSWDWLPKFPATHGNCKYLRVRSLAWEPRPDMRA